MLREIEHRGPDDWGMEFIGLNAEAREGDVGHVRSQSSAHARVALGHRRLSILDLSVAGRQPMMSRDGMCMITYNGEIYNYVELRNELRSGGVIFQTRGDAEVLLEGYRHWGLDVLPRLDGMFAFALWDSSRQRLVCARDPLGIKPFYYGSNGDRFVFGSEPRAVLKGLETTGHVDLVHLAEFLVLGICDHDEGTSYSEVRQLRGGEWMEVDSSGQRGPVGSYWSPSLEPGPEVAETPWRIRQLIDVAVGRQLRSDVRIGACLSGGLDSSSVVTTAARQLGAGADQLEALTLCNPGFEGDEAEQARNIALQAGVGFHEVRVGLTRLPDDLDRMVRMMGEPFAGLSMLAGYKVMESAKALGLKVMLNGQGGDEVFLGYPRNARRVLGDLRKEGQWHSLLTEWLAMRRNMRESTLHWIAGNAYFRAPRVAVWRSSRRVRQLVAPELLALVRPAVAEDHFSNYSTHRTQVLDLTRYCLPRLLKYEDRNSMAFGLETRVPLLSAPLVKAALELPLVWRVRNGWTKYALREAMAERLPGAVVWSTRKRGFEVPAAEWLRALRPVLGDWLSGLPRDLPLNPVAMLNHIDGGTGSSQWFWRCVSTALWLRVSAVGM
jgi:asparagine synthase (glutamine-hydrolysing)